ncbi:MAG: AAA family ATPase [Acidimicrobiaceae bacterium]|nr:AAA family ATPase [Acidimicrobiaceae bacterium]
MRHRELLTPPGRVVLLNGAPSSGKTTLARALQRALDTPWFHLSLDVFRAGYPDDRWLRDDGTLFEQVMVGYLGALRQLAESGIDLLAEAVITPDRQTLYAKTFQDLPVLLVGVHCSHTEAIRRERERFDRLSGPLELPWEAFAAVHAGMSYDLEVDTSTTSAESLARRLATEFDAVDTVAFQGLVERVSEPRRTV